MPMYSETYETLSKRFKEWVTDRDHTGSYVSDIILDYINRAKEVLCDKAFWEDLMKQSSLTLTNKVASLPSDYAKTYGVFHDSDGDGKPDFFYYNNGKYENGYRLQRTFSKAAGSSFTMSFFRDPSYTVTLLYQALLEDYTGEGTEYLFFPGELMLKQAQILYKEDADDVGGDYDRLVVAFNKLLTEFKAGHQYSNPDFKMEQNDAQGNVVQNENYNLLDGGNGDNHSYDNSTDTGLL